MGYLFMRSCESMVGGRRTGEITCGIMVTRLASRLGVTAILLHALPLMMQKTSTSTSLKSSK